MALPVTQQEVESRLRPWLGSLFLSSNDLSAVVTEKIASYAPYRQTADSLRDELEVLLLTKMHHYTGGTLTVVPDNYRTFRMGRDELEEMTDDLMGLVFEKLTPFSANFLKINDYSLHHASLNALRVLYQKYAEFQTEEERVFLISLIKNVYPKERYEVWLKEE